MKIEDLTPADKGRWVIYKPIDGRKERGKLKWWSHKFVYVVYHCLDNWEHFYDYPANPTRPEDLEFEDQAQGAAAS